MVESTAPTDLCVCDLPEQFEHHLKQEAFNNNAKVLTMHTTLVTKGKHPKYVVTYEVDSIVNGTRLKGTNIQLLQSALDDYNKINLEEIPF